MSVNSKNDRGERNNEQRPPKKCPESALFHALKIICQR